MKDYKYPNIEAERARAGLSVEDLMTALGGSRKTYYNWTHKGKIPKAKLELMANIFKCSVDYLLRTAE